MKADYDSKANALSIDLSEVDRWDYSEPIDDGEEGEPRVHVAIAAGDPVNVELLYPDLGLEAPLRAVAERYEFDAEALIAAACAALAAPDRLVTLDVGVRAAA